MTKEYIQFKQLLKRENHLNRLEQKGFKFIIKKNKFKVIGGFICLGIALFPNGLGFVFYPLSFILLGFNKMDLYRFKEIGLRKFKRFLK